MQEIVPKTLQIVQNMQEISLIMLIIYMHYKSTQKRPKNGPAGAFLAPSAPKTGPAELGFFIFPACGVIHRSKKLTF